MLLQNGIPVVAAGLLVAGLCGIVTHTPASAAVADAAAEDDMSHSGQMPAVRVYVGTYTGGDSRGIYTGVLDPGAASLSPMRLVAEAPNPSFLVFSPDGSRLYAVNELGQWEGQPGGAVSAYAVDRTNGTLELVNRVRSHGSAPCHLTVTGDGSVVLVANYGSGTVTVLPVLDNGGLGEATQVIQHRGSSVNASRQEGPHAHSVTLDPSGKFALAADLGIDRIMVYRVQSPNVVLVPAASPWGATVAGAGPRHFAFRRDGSCGYVINELDSTIAGFRFSSDTGELTRFQVLPTLPDEFSGQSTCADIHISECGRFLYGSNRGHDSIAMFRIDPRSGELSALGHQPTLGRTPRNFAVVPGGELLLAANQDSDSIVVFRIDPRSGMLQPAGTSVTVPKPVCVLCSPNSQRRD